MKKLFTVALAALTAIPAFGQGPPQPSSPAQRVQHEVRYLTALLSLTPAQRQQATAIYTNSATAEESVHPGLRSAHESLRTAIKNGDAASIEQASNALAQVIARSTSTRAKADAAFYQILTPDQQSKLSDFESERLGPFPFGGPDSFLGPGPH